MKPRSVIHAPKLSSHGLARILSKMGSASRTQAAAWIRDARVRVNGRVITDPEFTVRQGVDTIDIDGVTIGAAQRLVLMLNKPRGLVTTASDEKGRDTVYRCLTGADLPWVAPVGRLDKASEGLLLFSNDPVWAARVTDPLTGPQKTYHVQIDRLPEPALVAAIANGATVDGERLEVHAIRTLRAGTRNGWLEVILHEGRNRHIRRLLGAFDAGVLRLIRVAIGAQPLGELPKGAWRVLTASEIAALDNSMRPPERA